ncbi:MAG: Na+/H+ antiporter subunit G [Burkholderiaceae bacterium]
MPLWIEIVVAVLLLLSAVMAVASALGLVRLGDFFRRMHVPALTATLGVWCVTIASVFYFTALTGTLALDVWLIAILMSITVPVTTVLLARAALFRMRQRGDPTVPPPIRLRPAPERDQD